MAECFEIFFDGDCPICKREIALVRKLDRKKRVRFTDISDPSFDPSSRGLPDLSVLMSKVHGKDLLTGELISGVEVFRRMYAAIDFPPLLPFIWISRLPLISHLLEQAYAAFAARRLKWTGRCTTEACQATDSNPKSQPVSV
ncbi:MAG: DUF393 domain-containing protein [Sandaracinaceae bacterium]|nr:DUF393 domain-containing protein [Sandaracinaceae bacterium]MDW8246815.1 DUF393 domain-containing protein [Sandaracinaceae bacterium]